VTQEAAQQSDPELVAAVLRKDRKATAEFVSRFGAAVHGYLTRRLMPRQDLVEEVFQQVFLEAWQGLHKYRGTAGVKAWLLGIARHKVQDHYRSRLRELPIDEDAPEPAAPTNLAEILEDQAAKERIWRVLLDMDEAPRLLLLWRYWEGWSAEAMAEAAGKTSKAVERSLARAREQFRRRWYSDGQRPAGRVDE
jgi:RNA polymerase sigma-70 factor, ECF subfamily